MFTHHLERYRRPVLLVVSLLALLLLPGLWKLETDNSPEQFFVSHSPLRDSYDELLATFGENQVVRLALSGPELWSEEGITLLARLEEELKEIPGIEWSGGPLERVAAPRDDPAELRNALLESPLARQLGFISRDGHTVTLTAGLVDGPATSHRETLAQLDGLLADLPPGIEGQSVGLPVLNRALDHSSEEITRIFFPLLALFAVVLLALHQRHATGVLIPLAFVGFCELLTLALMGYLGVRLNLVLAILPPLLFVIALATALHLQLHFRRRARNLSTLEACSCTWREKGWSVLWTGLSTIIGFASLAVSGVAPVRALGLWAAAGIAGLTLAAFLFLPPLFATWPPEPGGGFEASSRRLGTFIARWTFRNRRGVLLTTLAFTVLAAAGIPRLRVETNALRYLAEDHPVRRAMEGLENQGIGLSSVEILITDAFTSPEEVERLAFLAERWEGDASILGTVSAGLFLQEAASRFPPGLPGVVRRNLALDALRGREDTRALLRGWLTEDGTRARVTVFVPTIDEERLRPLMERLSTQARNVFPEGQVVITGQLPLLVESQRQLLRTLGLSLAFTILGVGFILRLLLPGMRLALLALLPNLWPVVGILGFMGWTGVPLDIATVMVASVVLGLAVDDSLHTLGHFRHLAPGLGAPGALVRTLNLTAPAYLLTGALLTAGFGVCALSSFAPTARFGLLSALAIGLAVLGDLFLLPALLSLTPRSTLRRWGRRRSP
jgi:hypothetical protein